ncbi:uncharacterized protein LOC131007815 [Salvia miltiorrhiza]|uniref:uncharacterized protein LOC131007814 n=1 Tax=Salvia miltiorrhiza TaxID=226208 RepID=UPI0025AD6E60|nr:uncharacterized protein LOC131007814 [Salvia miltiorrhiza]XP_057790715.1 uncharacterized protein LOC131007815 [Salvia miltiorrhiza]
MKFLLELVGCCVSSSSETRRQPDDARLLVVEKPLRRAARKHDRARGGGHDWRPSLSSISEDVLTAGKINNVRQPAEGWQRSLKRKVASMSQRDRRRSLAHDDYRRAHISSAMPAFSPAPFMF